MIKFTGRVKSIIFASEEDLFKILNVEIMGQLSGYQREEITVTGSFGEIETNSSYEFTGQLVRHDKFGLQFKAQSYQQVLPHEAGSLNKFLSSSKFPGIGKKAAEKIIAELGLDALSVIKENPAKVDTLSLTRKQKDSLLNGINTIDSYSEIVLKLAEFGINKRLANQLYQLYHGEVLAKLTADPYEPIAEISGYNFKTADKIAQQLHIAPTAAIRIQGAVFQVLLTALTSAGNTYVALDELLTEASKILNITDFDPIADAVNVLQKNGKVVVNDKNAALQNIYQVEDEIALNLQRLEQNSDNQDEHYSDSAINQAIANAEEKLKINYDPTQKKAIYNAVTKPISILTGGPGTGKTTIINGILLVMRELADIPAAALYSEDPPFLLAAPTGRAAKRMSEITGMTAKTIHRLLGIGINGSGSEDLNELNGELLIIDEMSMVDIFLFKDLVTSINNTSHIVLVGDQDQLPSVGAGNVFADLIQTKAFATSKLTQIHRQGEDSTIISLAHAVNAGKETNVLWQKTKNYSFIPCQPALVGEAVGQIVKLALKKGFSSDDIQVLAAMYSGKGGINNLNNILQQIMNPKNPGDKSLEAHNEVFHIGDRLLQLQNNPEKDIYNGQIGKVVSIDDQNSKRCLVVNFDEREVAFAKKELLDLTRAYAITIHKSQGSEFPLVILNLTMQNYMMLRRNLLYTAITRAEKNLVMVGEPRAFAAAMATPGNDRQTGLTDKIKQKLPEMISKQVQQATSVKQEKDFLLTPQKIYSGAIDPMIGMKGVKLEKK